MEHDEKAEALKAAAEDILGDITPAFRGKIIRALVTALVKKHGTIEHLQRIPRESELVADMIQPLFGLLTVVKTKKLHVTYEHIGYEELVRRNPVQAHGVLFNKNADLIPTNECEKIPREPREIELVLLQLNRHASRKEIVEALAKLGMRAALWEEHRAGLWPLGISCDTVCLGSAWVNPEDHYKYYAVQSSGIMVTEAILLAESVWHRGYHLKAVRL